MKKAILFYHSFFLLAVLLISCTQEREVDIDYREKYISQDGYEILYENGDWDHPNYTNAFESFGNHRIVIEVSDAFSEEVNLVVIPWRRRDDHPDEKDVIVVDAQTNTPVKNKHILEINNEFGKLIFKPNIQSSLYYVYYLPHKSTGGYYPKVHYKKADEGTGKSWFSEKKLTNDQISNLPKAKIISAQSIDDFHSFFPMEIIATAEELAKFENKNPRPYYLFPEYRERPIRMTDYLPLHWISETEPVNGIADNVLKGEFYTFQIGAFCPSEYLHDIKIEFTELKGERGSSIPKSAITCFNTMGTDLNGKNFKKSIELDVATVQALWFGIDLPTDAKEGDYLGQFIVKPDGLLADTIFVKLSVSSNTISNHGDDAPEKMSRLRWLNSTIGTDENVIIEPFEPVNVSDKMVRILGRDMLLNEYGFPERISSYFTQEMTKLKKEKEDILAQPIRLDIITEDGQKEEWSTTKFNITQAYKSEANWQTINRSNNFVMKISGAIEYDGMLDYKIKLIARSDITLKDIKLQIPMKKESAQYILGLGFKGGKRIKSLAWKWDVKKHQEGAWFGAVNKGLQYVLRDENYERPLNTNFYQDKPLNLPYSWYNEGKGGIDITEENGIVNIENYSGARNVRKGDTLNFNVRFLITPFKLIDTDEHFSTRFVHKYVPVDSVVKLNGTVVNVHHANEINPYINYPFYNSEKQKAYIEEAHKKGIKVKLYNTIRELTYKSYELFALKSLDDEILNDGTGGGHSWLQEHLKSHYYSAWHATRVNDASILNKGNSRWTNYYIEGINWLAKNQEIDGLYLDDIAFSRTTVKRIASVLSNHRDSFCD